MTGRSTNSKLVWYEHRKTMCAYCIVIV